MPPTPVPSQTAPRYTPPVAPERATRSSPPGSLRANSSGRPRTTVGKRMRPAARDALLVGLLGFALAVAFSWVPSLWYDEAATVTGATRSWAQLAEMLRSVDAVHGLFYAFMHVWFDLVGYTPFTLRLPSAVATGIAAGLIVPLVRGFTPRGTAILAGLIFCLLPRITWMGEEGRSFALATMFAVLLTLVFLAAWRRSAAIAGGRPTGGRPTDARPAAAGASSDAAASDAVSADAASTGLLSTQRSAAAWRWRRGRWWVLYSALAILATTLFLYVSLVVVAHGVTALCTSLAARGGSTTNGGSTNTGTTATPGTPHTAVRRGAWAALRGWAGASVVAGLVLLPFVTEVVGQAGQVSWIKEIGATTLDDIVVVQWFLFNPAFAAFGWVLILGGLGVLGYRAWRGRAAGAAAGAATESSGVPSLLALVLPWLVVPTLALIVLSLVMTPVFSPRYLSFAAPAAAILMAVAVSALPRRWLRITAVLACIALTAPGYVAQRLPEAKQQSSWSEVADLIAAERALEPAGTREAIIFGPVRQHPSATTRVIAYAYPDAFAGLVDVKLRTPAAETGQLWETRYPLDEVTDQFAGLDTVWLVTSNKQDWRPSVTAKLAALGYSLDTEWNLTRVNVLRFEN